MAREDGAAQSMNGGNRSRTQTSRRRGVEQRGRRRRVEQTRRKRTVLGNGAYDAQHEERTSRHPTSSRRTLTFIVFTQCARPGFSWPRSSQKAQWQYKHLSVPTAAVQTHRMTTLYTHRHSCRISQPIGEDAPCFVLCSVSFFISSSFCAMRFVRSLFTLYSTSNISVTFHLCRRPNFPSEISCGISSTTLPPRHHRGSSPAPFERGSPLASDAA